MIAVSPETEEILRAKAARTGKTPDEILREVLSRAGDVAPWRSTVAPPPENLTRDELIARMEAIAVRSASRAAPSTRDPSTKSSIRHVSPHRHSRSRA
jgi:hypothetical protein